MPWQSIKSQPSQNIHYTKELLFKSIFPANGPQVVPTGSCCRLWIFRSPSSETPPALPADNEHMSCHTFSLMFYQQLTVFVCLAYAILLRIHITNWLCSFPTDLGILRIIKLVLLTVFTFSPISFLEFLHTYHLL